MIQWSISLGCYHQTHNGMMQTKESLVSGFWYSGNSVYSYTACSIKVQFYLFLALLIAVDKMVLNL